MKLHRIHPLFWLLAAPALICALTGYIQPAGWRPAGPEGATVRKVYAYRQWQSTGIKLEANDRVDVHASGEWSYSPFVGLNGPRGGEWAPDTYPLPSTGGPERGGALLARVGENGRILLAGTSLTYYAEKPGTLYLRINDDLLGDNRGALEVTIQVKPHPTAEP